MGNKNSHPLPAENKPLSITIEDLPVEASIELKAAFDEFYDERFRLWATYDAIYNEKLQYPAWKRYRLLKNLWTNANAFILKICFLPYKRPFESKRREESEEWKESMPQLRNSTNELINLINNKREAEISQFTDETDKYTPDQISEMYFLTEEKEQEQWELWNLFHKLPPLIHEWVRIGIGSKKVSDVYDQISPFIGESNKMLVHENNGIEVYIWFDIEDGNLFTDIQYCYLKLK